MDPDKRFSGRLPAYLLKAGEQKQDKIGIDCCEFVSIPNFIPSGREMLLWTHYRLCLCREEK
jgi:hypothetical protein